jgi:hypothetical protein
MVLEFLERQYFPRPTISWRPRPIRTSFVRVNICDYFGACHAMTVIPKIYLLTQFPSLDVWLIAVKTKFKL